jgi:hypothetical protein
MDERRRHPRVDTQTIGLLRFADGRQFVSCRVVNVSDGGALLRSSRAVEIPDQFSLYLDVPNRHLEIEVAECAVLRRAGEELAVKFTESHPIKGLSLGL